MKTSIAKLLLAIQNMGFYGKYTHTLMPWGAVGCHGVSWGAMG